MTVEELLKPRRKLIQDYPGNKEPVGTIFTLTDEFAFGKYPVWKYTPYEVEYRTWNRFFEKYPHIYKRLSWYEDRHESDMPEYLKDNEKILKVIQWGNGRFILEDGNGWAIRENIMFFFEPATKQEYINFKNQNIIK